MKLKIKQQKATKITCDCGTILRKGDLVRHKRSNKHLKLMLENIPVITI